MKTKTGQSTIPASQEFDFTTAFKVEHCRTKLGRLDNTQLPGGERVNVILIDDHFTISIMYTLPNTARRLVRGTRKALCVGDLKPVMAGTRVVAKAELFEPPWQQSYLNGLAWLWFAWATGSIFLGLIATGQLLSITTLAFAAATLWIVVLTSMAIRAIIRQQTRHIPDFGQSLYRLLFTLHDASPYD